MDDAEVDELRTRRTRHKDLLLREQQDLQFAAPVERWQQDRQAWWQEALRACHVANQERWMRNMHTLAELEQRRRAAAGP